MNSFQKLSRKKQIAFIVWGLHFFVVVFLLIHHRATRSFQINRPIAVRTFIPSVSQISPPAKTVKPQPKQAASPKPIPPTQEPSKVAKKTAPTPVVKKESSNHLASVLKALESVEKKTAPKQEILEIPAFVQIQQPAATSPLVPSYSEFLMAYLQTHLDLPEIGEVKMTLKISSQGKLLDSSIVASENPRNSEFLKNRLPELSFPCFNDFGIDENSLTFTISFRNAEKFR